MWVFGQPVGSGNDDLWRLDLTGSPMWTQVPISGSEVIRDPSAVYDALRHRMLVFGGSRDNTFLLLNGTLEISLTNPTALHALHPLGQTPRARFGHAAIYDPVRDQMIVFGGYNGNGFVNDVWVLTLAGTPTWNQITPLGAPPARRDAMTAVYDPIGDRMLVFGGWDGRAYRNDVWSLELSGETPRWTQILPTGTLPSTRRNHSAAFDASRNRMIVFGGMHSDYPNFDFPTETWELRLEGAPVWEMIPVSDPPPGRDGARAVYDPIGDAFVLFGGANVSGHLDDTWFLSFSGSPTWSVLGSPRPLVLPSARRDHTTILDPEQDRLVVFGGWDGAAENDLWTLSLSDPPTWSEVHAAGDRPPARSAHTALYDSRHREMVIFGGYDGTFRNDVWALALAGALAWRQIVPAGPGPSGRSAMTAVFDAPRDRLVVFGGYDGTEYSAEVWTLNLVGAPVWTRVAEHGPQPSARQHPFAEFDPAQNELVVFGGFNGGTSIKKGGFLDDTWVLDLGSADPKWKKRLPHVAPSARFSGRGGWDARRERMVMVGGNDGIVLADSWELSDDSWRWSELSPAGDRPAPRMLHTATFDPVRDRLLLFGGVGENNVLFHDTWALEFGDAAREEGERMARDGTSVRSQIPATEVVESTPASFAVHGTFPNPAVGSFRVAFSLPGAAAATLEVFAIDGRRVAFREVGSLGSGRHVVRLADSLPAGVYLVRVTQGTESRSVKTAVLR